MDVHQYRALLLGSFVVFFTLALPVHADQLSCSSRTELRTHTTASKKYRAEWCADKTGLKEGPLRLYRSDGSLLSETAFHLGQKNGASRVYDTDGMLLETTTYENGKVVSERYNPDAVRKQYEEMNRTAQAKGEPLRISLSDDQTVRYDVTAGFFSSLFLQTITPDEKVFHDRLISILDLCAAFQGPEMPIKRVQVRCLKENGDVLVETVVLKEECKKTIAK